MMQLPETEREYMNALIDAAEIGASKALANAGLVKPFYGLAEAKRLFGSSLIDFLVYRAKLVTPIKDGQRNSRVRLERVQLESAVKTCNRAEYYKYLSEKKNKTKKE